MSAGGSVWADGRLNEQGGLTHSFGRAFSGCALRAPRRWLQARLLQLRGQAKRARRERVQRRVAGGEKLGSWRPAAGCATLHAFRRPDLQQLCRCKPRSRECETGRGVSGPAGAQLSAQRSAGPRAPGPSKHAAAALRGPCTRATHGEASGAPGAHQEGSWAGLRSVLTRPARQHRKLLLQLQERRADDGDETRQPPTDMLPACPEQESGEQAASGVDKNEGGGSRLGGGAFNACQESIVSREPSNSGSVAASGVGGACGAPRGGVQTHSE